MLKYVLFSLIYRESYKQTIHRYIFLKNVNSGALRLFSIEYFSYQN